MATKRFNKPHFFTLTIYLFQKVGQTLSSANLVFHLGNWLETRPFWIDCQWLFICYRCCCLLFLLQCTVSFELFYFPMDNIGYRRLVFEKLFSRGIKLNLRDCCEIAMWLRKARNSAFRAFFQFRIYDPHSVPHIHTLIPHSCFMYLSSILSAYMYEDHNYLLYFA